MLESVIKEQFESIENWIILKSYFMHKLELSVVSELSSVTLHLKVWPSSAGLVVLRATCSCSTFVVREKEADCGSQHVDP